MKQLIKAVLLMVPVILGISSLLFVIKMIWVPPDSMGMMMGKSMMLHHMYLWFSQTFWFRMIIAGLIIFIWLIGKKEK